MTQHGAAVTQGTPPERLRGGVWETGRFLRPSDLSAELWGEAPPADTSCLLLESQGQSLHGWSVAFQRHLSPLEACGFAGVFRARCLLFLCLLPAWSPPKLMFQHDGKVGSPPF